MLESLHIENIAVIKCADIDFKQGFTALTGETGAGKSMLIGSLELLLGGRLSKDIIRTGAEKAMVSAMFGRLDGKTLAALAELGAEPDGEGTLYLQRTVTPEGKSQTKLNGRTIPLSLQRAMMPLLVDIHGQHDNQMLLDPSSHIAFLDSFADAEQALSEYSVYYEKRMKILAHMAELSRNEQEKQRTIELLKYQIADIDSVKPIDGEEEQLEAKKKKILNYEKIRRHASLVMRALYRSEKGMPAYELLGRAASSLHALAEYLPHAEEYADKLEGFRYELEDIGLAAEELLGDGEEDADQALDRIESRLDALSKLERKYGTTVAEVLAYREKAARELEEIELSDEKLEELGMELSVCETQTAESAAVLTRLRQHAAEELEKKISEELSELEMGKARFKVGFHWEQDENGKPKYGRRGMDRVEFLISTNPGEPPKPLAKIASGGELSRVMLAIKSVEAGKEQTGTMIFDEIDTGVSGKTAQKIGIKLRKLAEAGNTQVICVTHAAQIAAVANVQLLIRKTERDGRAETDVIPLDRDGRIHEIARIMGGAQITDKLLSTAEELLGEYN